MQVYLKLLVSMMFWGGTFVAGRLLVQEVGPFSASFMRFLMASAFLFAYGRRFDPHLLSPTRAQLKMFALLGLTGVFGYNYLFLTGLMTVEAGRGAVIIATNPAITAVLAAALFGESFGVRKAVGVGVSLLGALTVVTRGEPWTILSGISLGDATLAGAVLAWVTYSLCGKQAMKTATPMAAVAWSSLLGTLFLLGPALAEGLVGDMAKASLGVWLELAYMAVLATGLAFFWYYDGIRAIGAGRAAAFINFVPVSAAVLGYLVLGETLAWSTLGGGALVLTGVYLTNRAGTPIRPR